MTTQARELAKLVSNAGDLNLVDDISLASDGALLNFGADSDVVLTHVADTGLLLNSTRQLQFGDSGTYIHQSADGVLDLVSDTEIEINATTIDINGNVDISGSLVIGGADISEAELETIDGITAGTVAASKAIIVDANKDFTGARNITLTGELDAGSLDISGDADIDGTLETDALSINGTAVSSTAAELNFSDGVTSNIQTQLDTKAGTGKAIAMAIVFG